MRSTETFNKNMRPSKADEQPLEPEVEDQAMTANNGLNEDGQTIQILPALDLNDLKFSVKSTDMSENMILYVVEKTIESYQRTRDEIFQNGKRAQKTDQDSTFCRYLKFFLDTLYGPSWHVICGGNYGSFFTHIKGSFIVYTFEDKWITVFQSA
jgi:hypothetical protein